MGVHSYNPACTWEAETGGSRASLSYIARVYLKPSPPKKSLTRAPKHRVEESLLVLL
jgi:hypothetical protein